MNEENNNSNTKLMTNLKKQVNEQISTLTTKIPAYSELNDEGKKLLINIFHQLIYMILKQLMNLEKMKQKKYIRS